MHQKNPVTNSHSSNLPETWTEERGLLGLLPPQPRAPTWEGDRHPSAQGCGARSTLLALTPAQAPDGKTHVGPPCPSGFWPCTCPPRGLRNTHVLSYLPAFWGIQPFGISEELPYSLNEIGPRLHRIAKRYVKF